MAVVLKDLLLDSKDGEWGKGEPSDNSVAMLAIRGTDFDDVRIGALSDVPIRHIPLRIAVRKTLRPLDIVFETAGGSKDRPTGRSVLLKASLFKKADIPLTCASFARFLRIDPCKAAPEFMFWMLQYMYNTGLLKQYHTQHTGVARYQYTTFAENEPLFLPERSAQHRIASILSAYDDLIENNTRRIAILEEMARRIYEEWFVRFRFPGHENVRMVESELGLVPDGWRAKRLGDEIELTYGKALKAEERKPGKVPVYGSSGVVGQHAESLAAGPGIIVGRKGNVGSVHWSQGPFYAIDTVFYVKTKLPLHFVFFNLQRQNFLNNDAAVPGLNRNQAYALPILVPSPGLLVEFETMCASLLGLARNLAQKNTNLRTTRDLLLPKLISGELDVSELPESEAIAA